MNFTKIVRLGTTLAGKRRVSVYCEITYKDRNLAISGVEGPYPSGNCAGGTGQIDMHMDDEYIEGLNLAPGWTIGKVERFVAVWREWHLNDLQAACEHQRALGWKWTTHPMAICPVCGYELGSAWLRKDVPKDVLDWLRGLPDTDKEPAWV